MWDFLRPQRSVKTEIIKVAVSREFWFVSMPISIAVQLTILHFHDRLNAESIAGSISVVGVVNLLLKGYLNTVLTKRNSDKDILIP